MKKIALTAFSVVLLSSTFAAAQPPAAAGAPAQPQRERRAPDPRSMGGGDCRDNPYNCNDVANPLPPANTVWLEEMTWIDVRDALKAGKTNIIVPTGGMEPNGVWLVTGKHNYVLHANCEAIARKMGNALCAPIVKFVPEGGIEPKTGHMTSPGTITAREETYQMLLTDIAESLQAHGFKNIIFIGDSGGNQKGQQTVADKLTAKWAGKALALHIGEYYDYASVAAFMKDKGVVEGKSDGMHDDPIITLNMFIDDPKSVRFDERVKAGKATINGVNIADKAKNTALAKQIVEFRATKTIEAINKHIAAKSKATASQQ
jgi:creatinine amidohydrolase/Fe(II)-dependent formamide hydrolase-like protein